MKNLKKPTYSQKQRIAKAGVDPMSVLVKLDSGDSILLVDKATDKVFEINGKHCTEKGESN